MSSETVDEWRTFPPTSEQAGILQRMMRGDALWGCKNSEAYTVGLDGMPYTIRQVVFNYLINEGWIQKQDPTSWDGQFIKYEITPKGIFATPRKVERVLEMWWTCDISPSPKEGFHILVWGIADAPPTVATVKYQGGGSCAWLTSDGWRRSMDDTYWAYIPDTLNTPPLEVTP